MSESYLTHASAVGQSHRQQLYKKLWGGISSPYFFWFHLLGICKLHNFYLYNIYVKYNKKGGETSCVTKLFIE